jgi:hypothetical protein
MSGMRLGTNAHLFARPHRREELRRCFEDVLACGPVTTVEHPALDLPMLLVRFPGGGSLSIEFRDDAPDSAQPRLGVWLELLAEDPAAVARAVAQAGYPEVDHPAHPHYIAIPGGQVFAVAPFR